MSLDLLPTPTTPDFEGFPDGMLHRSTEPCPFKDDGNPSGAPTCCSFQAGFTAHYLLALGLTPWLLRLYQDKSPEEAQEFAAQLHYILKKLRHADEKRMAEQSKGSSKSVPDDPVDGSGRSNTGDLWVSKNREAAYLAIGLAARWHDKIATLHCGVYAWL